MSIVKIIRPGNHPGTSKINDYVFTDGVILAPQVAGEKMAKILCRYYGCKMEVIREVDGPQPDAANPDLTKSNTQTGVSDTSTSDEAADDEEEEESEEKED